MTLLFIYLIKNEFTFNSHPIKCWTMLEICKKPLLLYRVCISINIHSTQSYTFKHNKENNRFACANLPCANLPKTNQDVQTSHLHDPNSFFWFYCRPLFWPQTTYSGLFGGWGGGIIFFLGVQLILWSKVCKSHTQIPFTSLFSVNITDWVREPKENQLH